MVRDPEVLKRISTEGGEKVGKPHMIYEAPLLILICRTKDVMETPEGFDAGIIAEHIHLKASDLGLSSIILFGFIRLLGKDADYLKCFICLKGCLLFWQWLWAIRRWMGRRGKRIVILQ